MDRQYFEDNYCDDEAFEVAVDWHNNQQFNPVLCAGYKDNGELFYIATGSSEYEYDAYLVDAEILDQYEYENDANEYGEDLFEFTYADDFDEVVNNFYLD